MTTTLPTGKLRSSAIPCTTGVTDETLALFKRLCDLTGSAQYLIAAYERHDQGANTPGGLDAVNDFVRMTGKLPAVLHLEFQHPDQYCTAVPAANGPACYNNMRAAIVEHAERGGIIELDDFCGNPTVTGGLRGAFAQNSYMTRTGSPCAAVLSGGANDADFQAYATVLATFFNGLLDSRGRKIPVIFRPFHEAQLTGFWWGGVDRQSDYVLMWRRLVTLLKAAGVTNVLYMWNLCQKQDSTTDNALAPYSGWYPGDSYVDIVSLDFYNDGAYSPTSSYSMLGPDTLGSFAAIEAIAATAGKPIALAEVGYLNAGNQSPDVWERLGRELATAYRMVALAGLWRPTWGPQSGTPGGESFGRMCAQPECLTLDKL